MKRRHRHSKETKQKMSKAHKGKYHTEETKKKISKIMKGRHSGNEFKKGHIHSQETRKKISESLKGKYIGKNNPNWKSKRKIHKGYIYLYKPLHPFANNKRYVREHRSVIEKAMGRYLKPKERVHHWNEKRDDNHIENLCLFRQGSVHTRLHMFAFRHNIPIKQLKFKQDWLFE